MLYKEPDSEKHNRFYALVGTFFLALTFFTVRMTMAYIDQPRVLGSQIGGEIQQPSGDLQVGEGSGQGTGQLPVVPIQPEEPAPTAVIQQPTSAPQPTSVPLPTSQPAPVEPTSIPSEPMPTPPPVQEVVEIDDPSTEVIIRNDDNTIVIVDAEDNTPIAHSPAIPLPGLLYPGQPPSTVSPTIDTGTLPYPTPAPLASTSEESDGSSSFIDTAYNFVSESFTLGRKRIAPPDRAVPSNSIKITYTSNIPSQNLDEWLRKYQYQVWALGQNDVAIYRNGIVALTEYDVKLSLSKLSMKLLTENGEMQALYSHDGVWSYLSYTRHLISEDTHEEPMRLMLEGNELVYKVTADSRQMFLAFIPVRICRQITVSAETRDILDLHTCSSLDYMLDLISLAT